MTTESASNQSDTLETEHRRIRRLLPQLAAADRELALDGLAGAHALLGTIHRELVRSVLRHLRQEEAQVYPALTAVLGTPVPVMALLADHHSIQKLVQDLGRRLDQAGNPALWDLMTPAVRQLVRRLAEVLELHLRRERAALGALVAPAA